MNAPALAVLDVGNTAVKMVFFDGRGAVVSAARFPALRFPGAALAGLRRVPVIGVSVHGGHLRMVERALAPARLLLLGRDFPLLAGNRTARPRETGHDRLCAAIAAHHRAGGTAVALGLGTAVTVDMVDGRGMFLGGAIAAGLRAAAAGLAAAAPGLPPVDLAPGGSGPFPGRTTRGALRAGFILGFAGLVDGLAGAAVRARPGAPVFLHGGDAPLVRRNLSTRVIHAPHLVAEGARLLWLRAGGGA